MLMMYVFVMALALAPAVLEYVINSRGLYCHGKKMGMENSWIAWIPVVNAWLLGKIASKADEKRGIKKAWHWTLLILNLCTIAVTVVFYVSFIVIAVLTEWYFDEELFFILYLVIIPLMILAIVYTVCYYICLYKLYENALPEKSIKYLIISIIVPYGEGVCLILSAGKGYTSYFELPPVTETQFGENEEVFIPEESTTPQPEEATYNSGDEDITQ